MATNSFVAQRMAFAGHKGQRTGGLAALAAILGVVLKTSGSDKGQVCYGLASVAIGFLILCWLAVWALDIRYYNRLLEGSVNAILLLEKDARKRFGARGMILSGDIERAFRETFEHEVGEKWQGHTAVEKRKRCVLDGRKWFYWLVLVGLLFLLCSSLFMMCCEKVERIKQTRNGAPIAVQVYRGDGVDKANR